MTTKQSKKDHSNVRRHVAIIMTSLCNSLKGRIRFLSNTVNTETRQPFQQPNTDHADHSIQNRNSRLLATKT